MNYFNYLVFFKHTVFGTYWILFNKDILKNIINAKKNILKVLVIRKNKRVISYLIWTIKLQYNLHFPKPYIKTLLKFKLNVKKLRLVYYMKNLGLLFFFIKNTFLSSYKLNSTVILHIH